MPVILTVHTCRCARERQLAHDLQRELRAQRAAFAAACDRLFTAIPMLRRGSPRLSNLDYVRYRNEVGRPCATVFAGTEPYITITDERA